MHKGFSVAIAFLGLFLFVIPSIHAQEPIENFNTYSSLDLAFSLTSGIDILPTGGKPKIDYITADLSFFPQTTSLQTVSSLQTHANPPATTKETEKYVSYTWQNPPIGSLTFDLSAGVQTTQRIAKISKSLPFPIKNVESDVLPFTQPTPFIDLNDAIQQQAYQIIGSETDLFKVVFQIADWTKTNIKYDLNTLTAEAVQKSSWVLQNREGVCDEMTNLFISLLRSVGIPARFVSGMVYTNLDYQWGPHGWAEVYFPGEGWVPFDVTFGQYGWVDVSHIKLKESSDSGSPSAEYSWQASGVEVKLQSLQPRASLRKTGASFSSPLTLSIEPLRQHVGSGSFVPLLVTVTNIQSFYVSTSLNIKKSPTLTGNNVKEILLLPGETKTIGWIASIPSSLDSGYVYTSALEVGSAFGDRATGKINYAADYPVFSEREAAAVLANLEQREEKKPLTTIQLSCGSQQSSYYANESAVILCTLKNTDARDAAVTVCARTDCQEKRLVAGEEDQLSFTLDLRSSGRIPITAETEEGVTASYVSIQLIAIPELYVTNIQPETIAYDDTVKLTFDLNTDSPLKDTSILFAFGTLDLEAFQGSRQITIDTNGKSLYMEGLKFTATFTDEKGEKHTQQIGIPLEIADVPWYAKVARWVRNLF